MLGILGKILISASFVTSVIALIYYYLASRNDENKPLRVGNWLFAAKTVFLLAGSGILVYLIFQHQFQYYYVFNYTSLDLTPRYLFSAFYGGQEGSFMLWILFSAFIGFGLMKWTRPPYRGPVLFFLTLTQVFLLSMILGWDIFGTKLGASPFRTIAEEMPNAPFLQSNPDFVPADGSGLNDLLKSPWMMIHPPVLFIGFAMMTIPYCFAMAALWKRTYNEWVNPALPWTLGANVALLTAIFLGGYWAYVTLSFGGYWAWDPVENASLVPWLIGTAGIHTMIIQRKSAVAQKSSILFAILAYVFIVYETFLTRSGILGSSSVHSFVDLGLYNQLLAFMLVVTLVGLGLFFWRYKELPSPDKESSILSREFMTVTGAMALLILGLVIILGTSSPILGRLFVENPTPPEISFYNDWSMPIVMIMAILTVIGQFLFWKKHDAESLASALINPLLVTSALTIASIIWGDVRNLYYMAYLFCGWFAVVGNGWMMIKLAMKKPKLIGGSLTHLGFGMLLVGILASSAYNEPLVDQKTAEYNAAVERGEVTDEQGFTVTQKEEMLVLNLNEPVLIDGRYMVTYEGYDLDNSVRRGQQTYKLRFEPVNGGKAFYMKPEVYPMLTSSSQENIQWSVDPDVRTGLLSDIYLYVGGSSYVEEQNNRVSERSQMMQNVAEQDTMDAEEQIQNIKFALGETIDVGKFKIRFVNYSRTDSASLPPNTSIGVRAEVELIHPASERVITVDPLFAVYSENGQSYIYSPPSFIPEFDLEFQFTQIFPQENSIELTVTGLEEEYDPEWVLIVADEKPFISVVWAGTFVLMAGFSLSIFRHWGRERKKNKE
ncbi:heme lyase CcmF/NrfE family subunit [Gracilimonas mengyeensis]|uniref:Cytochrome c-type biogenesis protein CcmF n=1 Tax=Gracilimonas mengyeensis TaxID=1302730 RepID=A0A521AD44_9BACT|nr:cytochrome c biogenesis protein CcsA [Gracilimonas mengyeensis]SMO32732.1 cytochrome c-type biogenesis protein CcmF [Gracilimonas mengyeensis]